MDIPWLKAAFVGAIAGFFSGLLGIGGGVIVVPGLVLLIGLNHYSAAATSMATIVASSAAALYAFSGSGDVRWSTAAIVIIGAALGAWTGARWMHRVPEHILAGTFAVVMGVAAVRMWF
ncbi:MAG: sulfite exporter TauE/SafE family protein [Actinomycetota bacterium]|nr:sulfite exporter TauE/SafE family protein [Actinomycetota bacterium]MDK1016970.1 sulfite exporter TauE/SafE family protein [Actinomycetota bacterium]MDK1026761.1 sulfite exporter TauE/SafE family protein [Actinomycetota bacterium]MDK1039187.1 sulfite exporter TauE/SafE family protein [Actinomycetota bacterium]MDK1097285.1 sulfite exporter TauE/SafE family protein [Actinomycetota bacterium]